MASLSVTGAVAAQSRAFADIITYAEASTQLAGEVTGYTYALSGVAATFDYVETLEVTGSVAATAGVAATFVFSPRYIVSGDVDAEAGVSGTISKGKVLSGSVDACAVADGIIAWSYASPPTTSLDAIVLNIETLSRSHYANFAFDSLISFNGSVYGTLGGVLYQITGTTDAGTAISTTVRTGQSDFEAVVKKNVPDVYVNMETAGAMTVKSVTDNATESSAQTIAAYSGVTGIAPRRAKMPLGRMSRVWGMEISNVSGAASEIESIHMTPDQTEKEI